MWIEFKGNDIVGPARIGWVKIRDNGNRLDYGEKSFRDALSSTAVEIDEDALEEYWVNIRMQPQNKHVRRMSALGKRK